MHVIQLGFDELGWWNDNANQELTKLKEAGDAIGWFGVTTPPGQVPYFVSGATSANEAIQAGMPADAALCGELNTPSRLLD